MRTKSKPVEVRRESVDQGVWDVFMSDGRVFTVTDGTSALWAPVTQKAPPAAVQPHHAARRRR